MNDTSPPPLQRTLSILKPDAVRRNLTGAINARIEDAGLRIVAQKRLHMPLHQAESFYSVHKERAFFADLCTYMASGPVVVQILEAPNAIEQYRQLMGATNPEQADDKTIRRTFGLSIEENTVHGSDMPETAEVECAFFFSHVEIFP